jgi:hypothetical protein
MRLGDYIDRAHTYIDGSLLAEMSDDCRLASSAKRATRELVDEFFSGGIGVITASFIVAVGLPVPYIVSYVMHDRL